MCSSKLVPRSPGEASDTTLRTTGVGHARSLCTEEFGNSGASTSHGDPRSPELQAQELSRVQPEQPSSPARVLWCR